MGFGQRKRNLHPRGGRIGGPPKSAAFGWKDSRPKKIWMGRKDGGGDPNQDPSGVIIGYFGHFEIRTACVLHPPLP